MAGPGRTYDAVAVNASEVAARLKSVALFRDLSARQLREIVSHGWEHTFAPDAVLCREGHVGDNFFVILEGTAAVSRRGRKLRTLGPGDYFGEIALIDNAERTATVTAVTPLHCFLLGRSDFKGAIYVQDIGFKLLLTLAQRIRAAEKLEAD